MAVGTRLYPILGNIFWNSNYAIQNKSDSSCVLLAALQSHYCRWVGDTFTSFTRVITNLKNSCYILKSRHPNIKLTVENLYHKTNKTFTSPGTNCNSFMSSSFINNSVSTLNFIVNNSNIQYIFDYALHKYQFFSSKLKTSDSQENSNLCFSPIFLDGEE